MEEELDLMDMIKYFWKKRIWIVLVGVICIALALLYTKFLITPEYAATASFILTNNDLKTEADVYLNSQLPDKYVAITNSRIVWEKVISNLKIDDIKDIMKFKENNIEVTHSPVNFLIKVKVTTNSPKKSAIIANEIVKVSIEEIKNTYKDEHTQILDVAMENLKPVNISLLKNIFMIVVLGEGVVFAYIFILYMFVEPIKKDKLKKLEEKERISKEYAIKEKEFMADVNKTKKYSDMVKNRKELEKNIKAAEYKKVSKINDEILKYYAEEAYIAGYMDAKNSKEKSVEE